jgi:hypothetical protein
MGWAVFQDDANLIAKEGLIVPLISVPEPRITRRGILIGATATLICAPAIVRATSLMPVRQLVLPPERISAGLCQRLLYQSLEHDLKAAKMTTCLNGEIVSLADARRLVAYARSKGWCQ